MPAKDFQEQLEELVGELRTSGRHLAQQILLATRDALEVSAKVVGETAEALAASERTRDAAASDEPRDDAPEPEPPPDEPAVDAIIDD